MCMKPLGAGFPLKTYPENRMRINETLTPEECLGFALSHSGVTMAIPGPDKIKYLNNNFLLILFGNF